MIQDVLARELLAILNHRKCWCRCTLQRIFLIHPLTQKRFLDSRPWKPSEGPSLWASCVKLVLAKVVQFWRAALVDPAPETAASVGAQLPRISHNLHSNCQRPC